MASYGSRLAARLIDVAVLFVLNLVVSGWFILQFIDEAAPSIAKSRRSYEAGHFDNVVLSSRAEKLFIVITVISIALWLAYEVPAVLQRGQTLGKRLLGIKVIALTSHSLRFSTAMRRWAVMGLSLLFPLACSAIWLAVDGAWCLINRPARQCIHDKAAETVVVDI
ncbi:MAG: RDD family protein [Mycobacteriales bacterium]